MPTLRASHAEAFYNGQTQGARVGTLRGDLACADLNVITTTVTLEGDEDVADIITLTAPLREGQVIVPALCQVSRPADTATALTLDIGSASNPDSLSDALDVSSAGVRVLGTIFTDLDTIPAGEPIIATVASATSVNADTTITFYLVTRSI